MNKVRDTGIVRILIMDDERCIRVTTKILLEELGYRVDGAKDGKEAVHLFSEAIACGEQYHVVLLDLTIRKGNGAEATLAALKELDPEIKAVLISGYHYNPSMLNPIKHGFCASLRKPYSESELRDIIKELISIPTT